MSKNFLVSSLDNLIFFCLVLYSLTFLFDLKINFFIIAFSLGLIKLFFVKPIIQIHSKHLHFIILFIFCIFVSIILNPNIIFYPSFSEFISRFIKPLSSLLLILLFSFTYKKTLIILSGFSFTLLLNSIFIILQFFQGDFINTGTRLTGFSSQHYMFLSGVNLLLLPIIFTLSIHNSTIPKKLKYFFLITIIINIPAIIFENTRIVWIAFSIVFPLIIILSLKNKIKAFLLIIILFFYSFCCFQLSPYSTARLQTISSTEYHTQNNYERILMWKSATNMFLDHPILGVGLGNYYQEYTSNYQSPLSRENQHQPHNNFLFTLAESGILGFFPLLILFIYMYYKALYDIKNIFQILMLSTLLSYNINFLTDSVFLVLGPLKYLSYIFYLYLGIYLVFNKYIIVKFIFK
ncbi:Lipid A core - O-antigen ligase and related enzymes [Megamonas hypermegale]|uniref:Lipid A core - O-antigen ligase and related enzymes n=1 Tax=Megamonas hypermegale TaxID=158847 RepID=A0A378NW01_9FIRM|nr:O-antigen ligase family protein [Megamonas hypermegale]STY72056.1 Lipid A core - O-antigen ligase and related enzymes [Megamonas hypermegale]